jgi:hypothetical protein
MNASYINPIYEEFVFAIDNMPSQIGDEGFFYSQSVTTKMGL